MTVCCAATRYPPTAPSPGSSPPRIAVTSPPTDDELTDDAATWVVTAPHSAGYAVRVLSSGDARRYRDTARGVHVWHLWDEATGCPAQRGAIVAATQPAACDVADRVVAALWPQGDAPAEKRPRPCGDRGCTEPAYRCDGCDAEGCEPALRKACRCEGGPDASPLYDDVPAPFVLPTGDECFRMGDDEGRLLNLLAVIHRDGGHHTAAVGVAQSCCDAAAVVLAALHAGDAPAPRGFTDDDALDLDAIEARARKRESFSMRPLPSCDHEERGHAPACFACDAAARAAEGPTFHTHGRNDALALVARVRELEAEVADYDALIQRQGALLLATADALKGPPPPLSQHSAHDIPEVAAALAARVRELEAQVAAARSASTVNADRAQVDALAGARFAAEHPDAAGRIVG